MSGCKHFGCSGDVSKRSWVGYCVSHYFQVRRTGKTVDVKRRTRPQAPNGTGYVNVDGYRIIAGKMEHRSVMESVIGRELLPCENVHHKNGDRSDNRPENLELWNTSQPSGQRVEDKISWAKEILELYES